MDFFDDKTARGAWGRFDAIFDEGNKNDDVLRKYKRWAKTYDRDYCLVDEEGEASSHAAEAIARLCHNKDAQILDVCAGTGLVGVKLKEMGFYNLDALDGCQEMLAVAEEKNIYNKLILHRLSDDRIPVDDNTYDGLVCQNAFYPGHVDDGACFPELARIVKPGGAIVLLIEMNNLHRYEPALERMAADGRWRYDIQSTDFHVESVGLTLLSKTVQITVN